MSLNQCLVSDNNEEWGRLIFDIPHESEPSRVKIIHHTTCVGVKLIHHTTCVGVKSNSSETELKFDSN